MTVPDPCATQMNEEEKEGNDYHHQNGRSNGHALSSNNPPFDPNENHLRTALISFRTSMIRSLKKGRDAEGLEKHDGGVLIPAFFLDRQTRFSLY